MEFILVIVIVVVLCIVLGVDKGLLILGGLILLGLIFAAAVLLLTYFFVRLLFSKKHSAVFSRIDQSPKNRFKVAYYMVDGAEYPNVFPEEGFLRSLLYRSDKSCTVFLSRKKTFVYDKFAVATCTIGFILGVAAVVFAAMAISGFFV